jgi:hypothetical protein
MISKRMVGLKRLIELPWVSSAPRPAGASGGSVGRKTLGFGLFPLPSSSWHQDASVLEGRCLSLPPVARMTFRGHRDPDHGWRGQMSVLREKNRLQRSIREAS